MTDSQYRSIANPRRTTLASQSVSAAAAPRTEAPVLQMVGDDAPVCVDGVCELPD
jgi:hypothetical protein